MNTTLEEIHQKTEKLQETAAEVKKSYSLAKRLSFIMLPVMWGLFTVMIVVNMKVLRPAVKNVYHDSISQIADSRADWTSAGFDKYLNDLNIYTSASVVKTGDEEAVVSWLHAHTELRNPDYDYMFFCGADGSTHRDTGLNGKLNGISDRDYFKAVMADGKDQFIGRAIVSRTSGKTVVPITKAARDASGNIYGFFTGMLGISFLQQKIADIKIGDGGYLFITDQDGTIVAHPDSKRIMDNFNYNPQVVSLISSGKKGFADIDTQKDGRVAVAVAPISAAPGWTVGVVIPQKQIDQTGDSIRNTSLIMEIVTGIVFYLLVTFSILLIISRLNVVRAQLTDIAHGDADLTRTIPVKKHDEIGQLATEFNDFTGKIRTIIASVKESQQQLRTVDESLTGEIAHTGKSISEITDSVNEIGGKISSQTESVEQTAGSTEQISKSIESLEHMIEEQSSSVTQASAAVEQMIGNIKAMDTSMGHMADEFSSLRSDTESGIGSNAEINSMIRKIADESEMLQQANEIITSIAEQTNLLAMNAAIEAAHAGEAGKGFSVVADEIRKLSETSSEQSKRIGDELATIQETITGAVSVSNDSEKAFDSVSKRISTTDELVQQIHNAIQEQSEGSQQILQALETMNDSTTQVRTSSVEMTEGTKSILDEIEKLRDISEEIRTTMQTILTGTAEINAASAELTEASTSLAKSVGDIGGQIDLFKV